MQWRDLLTTAAQDGAYAVRQLRRAPAFTMGVIVTLALGIGANATMYGVIDRLLDEERDNVGCIAGQIGRSIRFQVEPSYGPEQFDLVLVQGAR